jgi:hypothetical protein
VLEFKHFNPSGTSSDVIDGLTHRYLYGNLVDQVLADERFTPPNGTTNWLPNTAAGTVLTIGFLMSSPITHRNSLVPRPHG